MLERLGFAVDGDVAGHRPQLAARCRRPGRSGRGSHSHRRDRQRRLHPAAARSRRRRTDRDARAEARAACCAAPPLRAGCNEAVTWSFIAEAEAAAFGGAAWRARQSDQRGHEGDAPVAAARPAVRRCAQPEARRQAGRACSRSVAAIWPRPNGPTLSRRAGGRTHPARLAGGQGDAGSTPSTPRPRRLRCWRRRVRRSTICRSWAKRATPGIPASRRRCGWGRRPCWRPSGCSTPRR